MDFERRFWISDDFLPQLNSLTLELAVSPSSEASKALVGLGVGAARLGGARSRVVVCSARGGASEHLFKLFGELWRQLLDKLLLGAAVARRFDSAHSDDSGVNLRFDSAPQGEVAARFGSAPLSGESARALLPGAEAVVMLVCAALLSLAQELCFTLVALSVDLQAPPAGPEPPHHLLLLLQLQRLELPAEVEPEAVFAVTADDALRSLWALLPRLSILQQLLHHLYCRVVTMVTLLRFHMVRLVTIATLQRCEHLLSCGTLGQLKLGCGSTVDAAQ